MNDGWDGLLDKGEVILWQGQPRAGLIARDLIGFQSVFGLVFAGFALFWMSMAASMPLDDAPFPFRFFPLFGLPFLIVGLYLAGGHAFWDAYRRYGTHYTLTSRTAFIARDMFGRRTLESWPISDMTGITLEDGAPGAVYFDIPGAARGRRADPVKVPGLPTGSFRPRLGFRQIDNPRAVYRHLRDAHRALTEARP